MQFEHSLFPKLRTECIPLFGMQPLVVISQIWCNVLRFRFPRKNSNSEEFTQINKIFQLFKKFLGKRIVKNASTVPMGHRLFSKRNVHLRRNVPHIPVLRYRNMQNNPPFFYMEGFTQNLWGTRVSTRKWRALFGCSLRQAEDIFEDYGLQKYLTVEDFLVTLHFLFVYPVEEVGAQLFHRSPTWYRTTVQSTITVLADHLPEVSGWY